MKDAFDNNDSGVDDASARDDDALEKARDADRTESDATASFVDRSGTQTFVPADRQASPSSAFVSEDEKTIVSQRPVAAPEEFYKSMPLSDLAAMLEGKQLDHFVVEQMIGGGGMGAVFRGRDERLDRTVAIKVIPGSKRDPETLRRFRLEAQAAARLDHPNIARAYYVGEAEQWNYIVFEFIDGVNIRDLVAMEGPLAVDDAVYYTRQVAEALQHAHQRQVVHRDIKPSNLLVTATGMVKVVDMGLARTTAMDRSSVDETASGVTLGTFDYISPEQARNPRDADVRSDLYSLGCSLFYMLTGKPPFPDGTVLQKLLKHGSVPPPDPRGWRDDLSDQLYAILTKLMAKQPSQRYQNPAELINDLLLLADVEDLQRSQTPGTMLMTPSIAQRTLIETNLPWMVAVAVLLGVALWLHSIESLSGDFAMPDSSLLASDAAIVNLDSGGRDSPGLANAPDRAPLGAGPEVASNTAGAAQFPIAAAPLPLVVSEYQPADVERERWFGSLQAAIDRLSMVETQQIEIRGNLELDELVLLRNQQVRIAGDGQTKARIELSSGLMRSLSDWTSAITLEDSQLTFRGVAIEADTSSIASSEKIGVFGVVGESELTLEESELTILGDGDTMSVYAVLADEERAVITDPLEPTVTSSSELSQGISLNVKNALVRGQGSFLGLRVALGEMNRFVANIEGSVFAVGGVGLDVHHATNVPTSQVARNLRLRCEGSTFYTAVAFAQVTYVDVVEPLLSLNRNSLNCVYDSAPGSPHLIVNGLGQESVLANLNRFLLKGSENAYDERVNILCRCYDRDEAEIFSFAFNTASQDGWFEERANEQQVRWLRPRDLTLPLSKLTRSDLESANDFFTPGFRGETSFPPF